MHRGTKRELNFTYHEINSFTVSGDSLDAFHSIRGVANRGGTGEAERKSARGKIKEDVINDTGELVQPAS